MFAHQSDRTKLGSVARDFISASHGMHMKDLPKRKHPKKKKHRYKPFGSLAHED